MKLVPLLMAIAPTTLAISPATADPRWRIDASARGIGSVELDDSATHRRDGLVPAFGLRALRQLGPVQVGGMIAGGMLAWYGKAEAALSLDHERVLARPRCELVADDEIGHQECRGARWSLVLGIDAGAGLLFFDAPPETPASSDALVYWGPLARARVQLHILGMLAGARGVGVVVGTNAALTSARYMSTATGTGLRLEPELEVGLTMRI